MADPAAQSPFVSSSSAPSEASGAACTRHGASACAVHDLIFWRDVRRSGAVFGSSLLLLLSLAAFSVVSVVAYLVLALLSATISFRIYKSVLQAVQKTDEGHPFKSYLELDIALSPESFQSHVTAAMAHVNHVLRLLLRLFLVEDLVDSLKLAVAMWLMTYVGAVFNGITLLILAELLAFTLPPDRPPSNERIRCNWTTTCGMPGPSKASRALR
ncbi:reticulon-3-like [Coturnix japonica]|uniref:reticulon-3-like n=1 Tax=Coturnix japonica TaxID=93934 RepID=UPI00077802AF|nr:reticulon-3-like [Coturnix japonica]